MRPYSGRTPPAKSRPYSALPLRAQTDASFSVPTSAKHRSLQIPPNLLHKSSFASIVTNSTTSYTIVPNDNNTAFRISQTDLQRHVTSKEVLKQQKKTALPLFPTERTRGLATDQKVLKPLDITKIDLLPIEFSRRIIMSCIDEIRLRGLKHKYLFRNPFYSPSVEAALTLMLNPKKSHLFNVKMMRMDTVGGLLTTVISRTYPPLIPLTFLELLQSPNGYFCFELLDMLPELNRFLFVEILNICCDLVDNQLHNQISNSKLSVYPGSCCFGLDEYMPTWDTRYLLLSDVTKYSEAFYQIICSYRDERDLSAEELQQKLIKRDRMLADERLEALEREYGLEGAHDFLRREARVAQGLPPDSPKLPELPSDLKEISLYANKKEIVVADDAISVLNIQLDDGAESTKAPNLGSVKEEEEENIENIIADLRKSISVATLGSLSASLSASNYSKYSSFSNVAPSAVRRSTAPTPATRPSTRRPELERAKTLARFGSIAQNIYPVSPSDIFGTSRHAIERRELQGFLLVARTNKKRRSVASKRFKKLRLQSKTLRKSLANLAHISVFPNVPSQSRRVRNVHLAQRSSQGTHSQTHTFLLKANFATARGQRRERTRQLRKDIEVYQSRGLSAEEAMEQREADLKKKKRREKRARAAVLAKAAAAAQAEREMAAAAAAARDKANVTMEEAEILEAFDYLTDQEFEEFMSLASLTMQDVERIREKSAAAALNQVTKDIQSVDMAKTVLKAEMSQIPESSMAIGKPAATVTSDTITAEPRDPEVATFEDAYDSATDAEPVMRHKPRPSSILHMNSMDLLIKNANIIGDSNLRCYPVQTPGPTDDEPIQEVQQPQAVEVTFQIESIENEDPVIQAEEEKEEEEDEEDEEDEDVFVEASEEEEEEVFVDAMEVVVQSKEEVVQIKDEVIHVVQMKEDAVVSAVVPVENASSEPAQERTSEDSTASSVETVVSLSEPVKGLQLSPESIEDLGQSPETTKDPQPLPEPKLVTKAIPLVKQNIMRFEQSMQQKLQQKQEKTQPRPLTSAKVNISKFSAPAPAPAPAPASAPARIPSAATSPLPVRAPAPALPRTLTPAPAPVAAPSDNDSEEAAELRELLKSMTEEERQEYLRLSH
ncbi:hypothetical protein BGZ80_001952 [Entomortierella chlamydospora]|uniref:Rho-GAP domain-containing protein n=1 Tax=Entomortierella chlamydospora TaxID=101097 RepID=A0A9P6SXJ6_9FUNG|nr:hypothetical protein BGZ80_001952 [Entomortierella chlamydospora]